MPKLWFLTGIGRRNVPMLEVAPDVSGLKDWVESHFSIRPAWPDKINLTYSIDGTVKLVLELEFLLKDVSEVEALQAVAKAEMDKH